MVAGSCGIFVKGFEKLAIRPLNPLNRISQLNLQGVPDGGGIWAPCLSYDGNEAFLVYTNVKERGPFMTTDNYLVYTDDITSGKWSEPVYLNSLGFDPSLFHDDDGKNGC